MIASSSMNKTRAIILLFAYVATTSTTIYLNPTGHKKQGTIVEAFHLHQSFLVRKVATKTVSSTCLFGTNINEEDEGMQQKKRGYQFGDITKSLVKGFTGKDEYKFGDISRELDTRAKKRVGDITGINVLEDYKFGDITKQLVANYTNKTSYEFGDITKEVRRRISNGEYTFDDILLLFKSMVTLGLNFMPMANLLPIKVLIEMLNVGLAQELGGKFLETISSSLDKRFKQILTGNENYQLGDISKDKLKQSISKATGKDEYEFGDLTKAIMEKVNKSDSNKSDNDSNIGNMKQFDLDRDLKDELNSWDQKYLDQQKDKQ